MKKLYLIFCFLLAIVFTNRLQAQSAPTFTSTPVTAVNGNEIYTYGITTDDADGDVVTVTASLPSGWPTLTTTTQVSTFAGSSYGYANGTGAAAQFKYPRGIAIDASGTMYVADELNHRIRKITLDGEVTTLAGSGVGGFADGTGEDAQFFYPFDVALDASGNVYVADNLNHRIRKITPAGVVTTFAGSGVAGFANGTGVAAQFSYPSGVAVDSDGNVYVGDYFNYRIRKITPAGVVTTLAGSGIAGFADGTGEDAQFDLPSGVAVDSDGNVYVADYDNHRIRKITSAGVVTTLAGSGTGGFADGTGVAAQFNYPRGVSLDALENVYVADIDNHKIRKITPAGVVTTLAGSGVGGFADGVGTSAKFNQPSGVAIDAAGIVYVADRGNSKIRKITPSGVLTADATGKVGPYNVDVSADDGTGNITHQIFIIHVTNTFTATSGNWSSGGNWSATSIPTSSVSALIPLGKSLTVDITNGAVNNLTINGSLTIDAGKALTVSGTLINNAGPSDLLIKSDATGSGSLIYATGTPAATVQRYVDKNAWHLVAPVTNVSTANDFYIDASNDSWLTYHTESTNGWTYILALDTALDRNRGYAYWIDAAAPAYTVNFTGTLTASNQTPIITDATPGDDENTGYNLLGNPFSSAITFNSNWTLTNLEETIWFFNGTNYTPKTTTDAASIPIGQGFFVHANTSSSPSIIIPASQREHNTQSFYKSANSSDNGYTNYLKIQAMNNQYTDKVQISFGDNGSDNFENGWDASKMFGNEDAPQLYLVEGVKKLSYDHLMTLYEGDNKTISMSYMAGVDGEQTLSAETETLLGTNVTLEDLQTGATQDLRQNPVYSFNASKEDNHERFLLHFAWSPYGIGEDMEPDSNIDIYSFGKDIYIQSEVYNQGEIIVCDMLGRTIYKNKYHNNLEKIRLDINNTFVVVRVVTQQGVKSEKVYIK